MGKTILSEQFSWNLRDFFKGAIVAVLATIVPIVNATIESGVLTFDWKAIGLAALGGFTAYLIKNFLEPTKVIEVKPTEAKIEAAKAKIENQA